jgi:hypothetical protein
MEWLVYRNMALCSCLVSFAFSKWNSEVNDESKMVVLYQVHTSDKEPNSDHYKCLVCAEDVFHLSESNENSEEISTDVLEGTQVDFTILVSHINSHKPNLLTTLKNPLLTTIIKEHADLYHLCLDELCKEDTTPVDARIKQIDPIYFETCLKFLDSLKVLTYS